MYSAPRKPYQSYSFAHPVAYQPPFHLNNQVLHEMFPSERNGEREDYELYDSRPDQDPYSTTKQQQVIYFAIYYYVSCA